MTDGQQANDDGSLSISRVHKPQQQQPPQTTVMKVETVPDEEITITRVRARTAVPKQSKRTVKRTIGKRRTRRSRRRNQQRGDDDSRAVEYVAKMTARQSINSKVTLIDVGKRPSMNIVLNVLPEADSSDSSDSSSSDTTNNNNRDADAAADDDDDVHEQKAHTPRERAMSVAVSTRDRLWRIFVSWDRWEAVWSRRVDIYTESALLERQTFFRSLQTSLSFIPVEDMSDDDLLNIAVFKPAIRNAIEQVDYLPWMWNTNVRQGLHMRAWTKLSKFKFRRDTDTKKYNTIAKAFAVGADELLELWRKTLSSKAGSRMCVFEVKMLISQLSSWLSMEPKQLPPYRIPLHELHKRKQYELREKVEQSIVKTLRQVFLPTIQRMKLFLEKHYLKECRVDPGLCTTDGGLAYYEFKLREVTTDSTLDADDIHKLGLAEIERVKGEISELCHTHMGLKADSFPKLMDRVRKKMNCFFSDGDDIMTTYEGVLQRVKPNLHKFFSRAPRNSVMVKKMESETAAPAFYQVGNIHKRLPGRFYVNVFEPRSRPKYMADAITLHEAVGHHYQLSLAQEMSDDVPHFRKRRGLNLAFSEGFGMYLEWLGTEMDNVYADPMQSLGRLNGELLRAARLVIDTGIHCRSWKRDESSKWLSENTFLSKFEVKSEITRAILSPAHGVAYTVGTMKIRNLLRIAKQRLGAESFTYPLFHDILLSQGALPLDVLQDHVLAALPSDSSCVSS